MSTPISAAAAGARETSRTTTGQFGEQHRLEGPDPDVHVQQPVVLTPEQESVWDGVDEEIMYDLEDFPAPGNVDDDQQYARTVRTIAETIGENHDSGFQAIFDFTNSDSDDFKVDGYTLGVPVRAPGGGMLVLSQPWRPFDEAHTPSPGGGDITDGPEAFVAVESAMRTQYSNLVSQAQAMGVTPVTFAEYNTPQAT